MCEKQRQGKTGFADITPGTPSSLRRRKKTMGRKDIIEILRDYENEVASQYDIRMPLGWKKWMPSA